MGDRAAKRPGRGACNVDVNPLVVAGCLGELLNLFLGDLRVGRPAKMLADEGLHFIDAVDDARHRTEVGRMVV